MKTIHASSSGFKSCMFCARPRAHITTRARDVSKSFSSLVGYEDKRNDTCFDLGLDELYRAGDGSRPLRLFMCSVFERRGYLEGFQWLGDQL